MLPRVVSYLVRSITGGAAFFRHQRLLEGTPPPHLFLFFSNVTAAAELTRTGTKGSKWTTSQDSQPGKKPSFMAEYLVNSCGFSPEEAAKLSKPLAHIRSREKPDSVLSFLRSKGFSDAQVRKLVSSDPFVLRFGVEKTLKPKIRALEEIGLSGPAVLDVIAWSKRASLEKKLMPNISLLLEFGVPVCRMQQYLQGSRCLVTRSVDSLKEVVRRTEELGIARGSAVFKDALSIVSGLSRSTLDAKLAVFQSLGWTKGDTLSMIQKKPGVLSLTENRLREKICFLVNKVGFALPFVVQRPDLLLYSLEKRMIPRYGILQILQSKKLLRGRLHLASVFRMTETAFLKRFISPYVDEIPGLREAYVSACNGRGSERMPLSRDM